VGVLTGWELKGRPRGRWDFGGKKQENSKVEESLGVLPGKDWKVAQKDGRGELPPSKHNMVQERFLTIIRMKREASCASSIGKMNGGGGQSQPK